MQPTGIGIDHETLLTAWQAFMEHVQTEEIADGIDPAIVRSWRRCVYRFNPQARPRPASISRNALYSIIRAQQDLITIATPFIEDIHQFTEGSRYAVALADGAACLLIIGGDPAAVEQAGALGFSQGAYWSENSAGTNGLGLALLEAMPVQVVGAEQDVYKRQALTGRPPAAFCTSVNREAYLVRDAHSRFPAMCDELYAIRSFLRTRDERRFTNDGLGGLSLIHI